MGFYIVLGLVIVFLSAIVILLAKFGKRKVNLEDMVNPKLNSNKNQSIKLFNKKDG